MQNAITRQLHKLIHDAYTAAAQHVAAELSHDHVYAFVAYPSLGFQDLGVAISTRESLPPGGQDEGLPPDILVMLENFPDLLKETSDNKPPLDHAETTAAEWKYASAFPNVFDVVNSFILQISDDLDEEGFSSDDVEALFEKIIVSVLKELKREGAFAHACFESDLLMGIQFPDESCSDLVQRASKALNSAIWHEKITRNNCSRPG